MLQISNIKSQTQKHKTFQGLLHILHQIKEKKKRLAIKVCMRWPCFRRKSSKDMTTSIFDHKNRGSFAKDSLEHGGKACSMQGSAEEQSPLSAQLMGQSAVDEDNRWEIKNWHRICTTHANVTHRKQAGKLRNINNLQQKLWCLDLVFSRETKLP